MIDNLALFVILALVAEILGTVGGFGSSLFFVPIAGYFLDFHSVLGITALFHVSSNLSKITLFREGIDKKLLPAMGIPAVVFVIGGAFLSKYLDSGMLELLLSVMLIVLSVGLLIFKHFTLRPTVSNAVGGGAISGLLAGLLGTGGAIRGIALSAFNLRMEAFIATSAIIDLAIDGSRSIVYGLNGFIHRDDLYLVAILFVVSVVGTYLGKLILGRVSEEQFRSLVLLLILITGIASLVNALYQ